MFLLFDEIADITFLQYLVEHMDLLVYLLYFLYFFLSEYTLQILEIFVLYFSLKLYFE